MPSDQILGKVTAFVTRAAKSGRELLVFHHPNAGIQLPAGTIEAGETPEQAVIREVNEETGLAHIEIMDTFSTIRQQLAPDEYVMLSPTLMQAAPGTGASKQSVLLNRGWRVRVKRIDGDTAEVVYETFEMKDKLVVQSSIEGWIPANALTRNVDRHFFHLQPTEATSDHWKHPADMGFTFTLYWAALGSNTGLVPAHQAWLEQIIEHLQNR